MDETIVINLMGGASALAVLWRVVWYQGQQIIKLTQRQDVMWERCFENYVDSDHNKE